MSYVHFTAAKTTCGVAHFSGKEGGMTRSRLLSTGWKWISVFLLAIATNSAAQAQIFGQGGSADFNNIFPLAPRDLRQRLNRAQAAVDEQRYSDAVAEIGEVLNST